MGFQDFLQINSYKFYYILVGMMYVIYAITFLGIYYIKPEYVEYLSIFTRVFIAAILLIRFNPFYKVTFSESDRILISAAAFFLLVNTGVTEYIMQYVDKIALQDFSNNH
jgi:hypothetical protein